MAFVFQPDPSLAGFNSFCDLTTADDYQSMKLNTAWANLAQASREKLLAWATVNLNSLVYIGTRTEDTQALEWPRTWVPVTGTQSVIGNDPYSSVYLDQNTVPIEVKRATAELAGILQVGDVTADSGLAEFDRLRVDVIELEMKDTSKVTWFKPSIRSLIWRFLASSSPYNAPTQRVG